MIELKNLSKTFGEVKALKNISLQILPAKIYGLLGPNGSGKSTLIRLILKILEPSEGEINFTDNIISGEFLNRIGYLPEERGLYKNSKVYDLLKYLSKLKGMSTEEIDTKITYWLERFEIQNVRNLKIARLSKGTMQKVQLISALIHSPDLLILDEPFTGFDITIQKMLKDILLSLVDKNRIIILSTHLMNFVEDICTDIIFLNNGELLYSGSLHSLMNHYSIKNTLATAELETTLTGHKQISIEEIFLKVLQQ